MTETLAFSTRAFAPAERFARYRDFYSIGSDTVALDGPVAAEIQARRLEGLVVLERRLKGLGAERLARRVRLNQFDHFTIQLNLAGQFHGEGDQGFRAVRPGEILLLDMARPMRTRMPDVHLITVSVTRSIVEAAGASTDALHGVVIPADRAAALGRWLASATARAASPEPAGSNDGEILTELLGAALSDMGLAPHAARQRSDLERMNAARRFIEAHLFDETLDPAQVARAVGVSRATLYRLFDDAGGVRKRIQVQRLMRLRRSLFDLSEAKTVAALAFEAGFASENHASRSFKQAFGRPPAEFRRDMRQAIRSEYDDQADRLKRRIAAWYSRL